MKKILLLTFSLFIFFDFFAQLPNSFIRSIANPNYYEIPINRKKLAFSVNLTAQKAVATQKIKKAVQKIIPKNSKKDIYG